MIVKNLRTVGFNAVIGNADETRFVFGPVQDSEVVRAVRLSLLFSLSNLSTAITVQLLAFPSRPAPNVASFATGLPLSELLNVADYNTVVTSAGALRNTASLNMPIDFEGGGLYRYLGLSVTNPSAATSLTGHLWFDVGWRPQDQA